MDKATKAMSVTSIVAATVASVALAIGVTAIALAETKKSAVIDSNTVVTSTDIKKVTVAGQYFTNSVVGDWYFENTVVPNAGFVFGNSTPTEFVTINTTGVTVNSGNVNIPIGSSVNINSGAIIASSDGITIASGFLKLPTVGGTPSDLNYYEEIDFVTGFSGALAVSAITFKITRIGNKVYMSTDQFLSSTTVDGVITSTTALPARFRPTFARRAVIFGSNSNVSAVFAVIQVAINTGGSIVFAGINGGNFVSPRSFSGWSPFDVFWEAA